MPKANKSKRISLSKKTIATRNICILLILLVVAVFASMTSQNAELKGICESFIMIDILAILVLFLGYTMYGLQCFSTSSVEKGPAITQKFEETNQFENELIEYLKKQHFNFKDQEHLIMIKEGIRKNYHNNLKSSLPAFGIGVVLLIFLRNIWGISIFAATAVNVLRFWPKKFSEASLEPYTCPHCSKKCCWFLKKEFDTDEKYLTKHERREEKDSKGKLHIVYAPVDYVKCKAHKIYYCEKCHYKKETIEDCEKKIT